MLDVPLVILAAGSSSRFFPLASNYHKGFYTVLGKSLAEHTLLSAYNAGVRTAFAIVSPHDSVANSNQVFANLPKDFKVEVVVQPAPLGMGDALLQLQTQLPKHFFVASPYHVTCGSILQLLYKKQQATECSCVLAGEQTLHPERYGIIEYSGDKVTAVIEKPKLSETTSSMKISSVYLLSSAYLQKLSKTEQSEYNFELALNTHAKEANICWVENTQNLPTLKYAWHLLTLMQTLLSTQTAKQAPTAKIAKTAVLDESNGPIVIADNAEVRDFVKILGPAYIGENTLVGEYSFIRQSSLESGARVGAYTEVVRSLICPDATVHQSYIADSILGPKTKVGAGFITANKRFDRKIIEPMVKGAAVSSSTKALGVITGNTVTLGIQVAAMPGTLIGSNNIIYPQTVVSGTKEHV